MLTALDFDEPPRAHRPHRAARRLRAEPPRLPARGGAPAGAGRAGAALAARRDGVGPSDRPFTHPVEDDPELDDRLKAAAQAERVAREVEELRQRVRGRSQSIARDFDRVLRVLENWGYVDGWSLTDAGEILARTFHECDLLIVECLRQGLLDDLDPAALAGLVSVFVYEHRSPEPPPTPWFPSPTVRKRWQRIAEISYELRGHRGGGRALSVHRPPDPTFVAVAFAWAAGEGFAEVVEAEELSGGDFVRTMKQLIDLLRQLALVAPERATPGAAPSRLPMRSSEVWSPPRVRSRSRSSAAEHRPVRRSDDDPQG